MARDSPGSNRTSFFIVGQFIVGGSVSFCFFSSRRETLRVPKIETQESNVCAIRGVRSRDRLRRAFSIDSIFISQAKLRQKVSQSLLFGGDNLMQRLTDFGNQQQ